MPSIQLPSAQAPPVVPGFDRLPLPGLMLSPDGLVVAVNQAAIQLLGPGKLLGRPFAELVSLPAEAAAAIDAARRAGETTQTLQLETGAGPRSATCTVAWTEVLGRSIIQVFAIPTTGRPAADDPSSAEQRLESFGIIAGGIAHEFNNLLVGVLAESSAARELASCTGPTRDALRRIEAAAQRMAHLTRQMLAYSGRGRLATQRVAPDDLISELREQIVRAIRPEVVVSVVPGAGRTAIQADPALLRQVVMNLVANASESGASRVEVSSRIVVRNQESWWQLEVGDDGRGIEAAALTRIFEPFFTTSHDRRGLGLSAVHGIVRRLGGDIEVDSRPGAGARFRVRLPALTGVEAPRRRAEPTSLPPMAQLTDIRVLIADDEPSVRSTVRRLLERRGAAVVLAVDGTDAEERLHNERFGLIILDVSMPGRSGYEVLATARTAQAGVPVLLMSGYTERGRGPADEEPDAFLEKPFTAPVLDAAIDDVMRRRAP